MKIKGVTIPNNPVLLAGGVGLAGVALILAMPETAGRFLGSGVVKLVTGAVTGVTTAAYEVVEPVATAAASGAKKAVESITETLDQKPVTNGEVEPGTIDEGLNYYLSELFSFHWME